MKIPSFNLLGVLLACALSGCGRPSLNGADGVGNGGGIGEQNVILAFQNLRTSLDSCLASTSECRVTTGETELLHKIYRSIIENKETVQQLVFLTENERPGFFVLELASQRIIRSARTGDNVGDRIYVNSNHLYTNGPISLIAATSLLVHELSHHHGVRNGHEELRRVDELCAKLASFLTWRGSATRVPIKRVFACEVRNRFMFQKGKESSAPWIWRNFPALDYHVTNFPITLLPDIVPGVRPTDGLRPGASALSFTTFNDRERWFEEMGLEDSMAMGSESCARMQTESFRACARQARLEANEGMGVTATRPETCDPTPKCQCDTYQFSNQPSEPMYTGTGRMNLR